MPVSVYEYAVVTKTDPRDLAIAMDVQIETAPGTEETGWMPATKPAVEALGPTIFLKMRQPVFRLGELLLLNSTGREVTGAGRKPDKWFVEIETFDLIDDAIARMLEIEAEQHG